MAKMVKEIAGLCYSLDKLYYETKDKKKKREIEKNFNIMSSILEKSVRSEFNENSEQYKKELRRLKRINSNIKKFRKGMYKLENIIKNSAKIAEGIGNIISGSS